MEKKKNLRHEFVPKGWTERGVEEFERKFECFGRLQAGKKISQELAQLWSSTALPDHQNPHPTPPLRPTMAIAGIFYARFLPQEGQYIYSFISIDFID